MGIYGIGNIEPELPSDGSYWISDTAAVIGRVKMGKGVSIWPSATIRGDNELIDIGDGCNIQENCVLHTDMGFPMIIKSNCTIGHGAILHGCLVGPRIIVGMGSIILNGAKIGSNCIIGAGTLIAEKKEFLEEGKLILGSPARVVRDLNQEEIENIERTAILYSEKMNLFINKLRKIDRNCFK